MNHVAPIMLGYRALRLAMLVSMLSMGSLTPNTGKSDPVPVDEQWADKIFANVPISASRGDFPPCSLSDGEISIQHSVQIPESEKDCRRLMGVVVGLSLDVPSRETDHAGSAASRSSSIHIARRSSDCRFPSRFCLYARTHWPPPQQASRHRCCGRRATRPLPASPNLKTRS
jgi:hypothetical protein